MNKKILITGAGGYIGSVAAYLFLQKGFEVVALDNFSTGFKQPLEVLQKKFSPDVLRLYEADLTKDLSHIFDKEKNIEAVVHYVASCSVDGSMKHPEFYFTNNVGGSQNLFASMMKNGIKNLVFSSTCAVYGDAQQVPIEESHPTNPESPYGESKRMVEKIIEWYGKLKDFHYVTLRYFNVCGASDDGLIGDSKKPSVHLMQNAVRGALGLEQFYLTYQETESTPDKSPIRDYVNVVDLNEAHLKAVEYLFNGGKSETINIGTGTGSSVLEIIEKVEQATGKALGREKITPRQGESAKLVASIAKAQSTLSWQPQRSLEKSVETLLAWYNNHPKGWTY